MYKLKNEGVSVAFAGIAQNISGPISDDLYKIIVKKNPKAAEFFVQAGEDKKVSAPLKNND